MANISSGTRRSRATRPQSSDFGTYRIIRRSTQARRLDYASGALRRGESPCRASGRRAADLARSFGAVRTATRRKKRHATPPRDVRVGRLGSSPIGLGTLRVVACLVAHLGAQPGDLLAQRGDLLAWR